MSLILLYYCSIFNFFISSFDSPFLPSFYQKKTFPTRITATSCHEITSTMERCNFKCISSVMHFSENKAATENVFLPQIIGFIICWLLILTAFWHDIWHQFVMRKIRCYYLTFVSDYLYASYNNWTKFFFAYTNFNISNM